MAFCLPIIYLKHDVGRLISWVIPLIHHSLILSKETFNFLLFKNHAIHCNSEFDCTMIQYY